MIQEKTIHIDKKDFNAIYDLCEFALAYIDEHSIRKPSVEHLAEMIKYKIK